MAGKTKDRVEYDFGGEVKFDSEEAMAEKAAQQIGADGHLFAVGDEVVAVNSSFPGWGTVAHIGPSPGAPIASKWFLHVKRADNATGGGVGSTWIVEPYNCKLREPESMEGKISKVQEAIKTLENCGNDCCARAAAVEKAIYDVGGVPDQGRNCCARNASLEEVRDTLKAFT